MKTNVIEKLRKCEEIQFSRAAAYVILAGNREVGRIRVAYPKDGMGPVHAFLWDWTDEKESKGIQYGKASGMGYDKLASALSAMTFGSLTFEDGKWQTQLKETGYTIIQAL